MFLGTIVIPVGALASLLCASLKPCMLESNPMFSSVEYCESFLGQVIRD